MLKKMLQTLVALEIPENLPILAELVDEAFAARDQLQEKLLALGAMLHTSTLQRRMAGVEPEATPKAKPKTKPKPTSKPKETRRAQKPSDPKLPPHLVKLLRGHRTGRGVTYAAKIQEPIIAWVQEQLAFGHYLEAISRPVKISALTLQKWLTQADAVKPEPKSEGAKTGNGVWCAKCARDHVPVALPQGRTHGLYSYRVDSCRCHVCYSAKKADNADKKAKQRARARANASTPLSPTAN